MIMITKLGHRVKILRFGQPEAETPTTKVLGLDLDSSDRDIFGKKVLEEFKLSDFEAIEGSYSFPIEYVE